jgi:hypothetical protein
MPTPLQIKKKKDQMDLNFATNHTRMTEFVQRNAESIANVLKGDLPAEQKLQLVEMVNQSTQEIVTKWKEVIYQGPYTADDISLFLLLDSPTFANQ